MRRLNQKGFAPIEGLLLLLAVIIVGAVGLYVMHSQSNADDNLNAASTASQSQPVIKKKVPAANKGNDEPIVTTFSKAPEGLKKAILAHAKEIAPDCVKDGALTGSGATETDPSVIYTTSGYAKTGGECGGGSAELYVEQASAWKLVAQTQMAYDCSLLKKYKVPVAIAQNGEMATCFDASNKEVEYKG